MPSYVSLYQELINKGSVVASKKDWVVIVRKLELDELDYHFESLSDGSALLEVY